MNRLVAAPLLVALVACGSADPSVHTARSAEAPPAPRQSAASGSASLDGLWEAVRASAPTWAARCDHRSACGRAEIAATWRRSGSADVRSPLCSPTGSVLRGELTADGRIAALDPPRGVRIPYPFASRSSSGRPGPVAGARRGGHRSTITLPMRWRSAPRRRDPRLPATRSATSAVDELSRWCATATRSRFTAPGALSRPRKLLAVGTHDADATRWSWPIRGDT